MALEEAAAPALLATADDVMAVRLRSNPASLSSPISSENPRLRRSRRTLVWAKPTAARAVGFRRACDVEGSAESGRRPEQSNRLSSIIPGP